MKKIVLFLCVLVFAIFSYTNNLLAKEIETNIKDNISNEIEKINSFLKSQGDPEYVDEILNLSSESPSDDGSDDSDQDDELYNKALEIVKSEGKASTSFLQRKLQIGYNRAARIIDQMEDNGVVSKANHVGKREVL